MVRVFREGEIVNEVPGHSCFGCGDLSEIGLKLRFVRSGYGVTASFSFGPEFEGYSGMIHGGLVSTGLDEAMSWAVISDGHLAVTARMNVEYRAPVPPQIPLVLYGEVTRDRGRAVEASGQLRGEDGTVYARSTSLFIRVSEQQQREWEHRYFAKEMSSS